MDTIIFDIETGPLPEDQIIPSMPPFEPPANIKDPVKIAEREKAYKEQYIRDAALSALTGKVIAIGWKFAGPFPVNIYAGNEKDLLTYFWDQTIKPHKMTLVGFNSNSFDLPFLYRRSWANRVSIPDNYRNRGRYWSEMSIDLREVWQLGDRMAKGSLDSVCKCLGFEGKTGKGDEFAKLWETNREEAEAYLRNDVLQTEKVYNTFYGEY